MKSVNQGQSGLVGGYPMNENTNTADAGAVQDPPAAAPVEQTTPAPEVIKATRAVGVKGVTKTAREMKDAGKNRAEVAAAVTVMYQAAGKDEQKSKNAASVIVYNIFGPVKPHLMPNPEIIV
jgi:hypothetical protein